MAKRPPQDITPKDFFESWLTAELAGAPGTSKPLAVRVELTGDGGGAWAISASPTGVAVAPAGGGGEDADVHVKQSVADWRAIVAGEPGAISLAPERASPTDLLFLDKTAQQIVQSVKGTIRFEVTGYNGRTWNLDVKIGRQPASAQPEAVITVDAETYAAMLARTIPAPQAYFQGKIRITGDVNLAMQIGMAMMPRM
jgi:hypothetical protein